MTKEVTKSETTQNGGYVRRAEEQRFEFSLFINDHIICQRFFNIRDYNEDSIKSLDMKELVDNIVGVNNGDFGKLGIIPNHLKNKSIDYLWNNYNPYIVQTEDTSKQNYDKVDNFQFEIRVDKKIVGKGGFSGNLFPPKVRYAVDIKAIIPSIISEIRYYLSQKNYENLVTN